MGLTGLKLGMVKPKFSPVYLGKGEIMVVGLMNHKLNF